MALKPTYLHAAKWMYDKFTKEGQLYQDEAAAVIQKRFGEEFVYENENGNLAISRKVLRGFEQATKRTAVWVRSGKYWRRRERGDGPGRFADE